MRGFATVSRMSENPVDRSGNTEAFRAFTEHAPAQPATTSKTPLIIGVAILAAVIVALVLVLTA